MLLNEQLQYRLRFFVLLSMGSLLAVALSLGPRAWAQQVGGEDAAGPTPIAPAGDGVASPEAPAAGTPAPQPEAEGLNLFSLLLAGGVFMIPIGMMSLLVVTFVIERFLGLRRSKVLPDGLVSGLGRLGGPKGGFDPRQAYRLCQEHQSAAANVIRAMLLKVGRPHSEVEHSVGEASEREADRMYANVRWLTLAAAVTPLMGLFGTVWGMITAFHDTTNLPPGTDKGEFLAKGIYIALVTTLAGLAVSIPAAIFAHYFEGRITALFHEIDELLFNLMPQIERFEGRVRFSRQMGEEDGADSQPVRMPAVAEPPVAATPK